MDLYNSEHYADTTAAQAMRRVMYPGEDPGDLDDEGCLKLIEAIVRLAAEDWFWAARHPGGRSARARLKEAEAFFRSGYFRRLTGFRGEDVMAILRKELEER